MAAAFTYAREQYGFVRDARAVLLAYCGHIADEDLLKEHPAFGKGGSIRNLLVHIANTYEYWIGQCALSREMRFTDYGSQRHIRDIEDLFGAVDRLMVAFIDTLRQAEPGEIHYEINGVPHIASPFRLFSHVITHEFHHKGQILTLSRQWGYTPVDTDIMR